MGLHSYANTRDTNEPQIVQALQRGGASVIRINTPCDLIVGHRKRTILLEVKMPGENLTPAQRHHAATFRGEYHIVENESEACEAVFGPSAIVSKGCR